MSSQILCIFSAYHEALLRSAAGSRCCRYVLDMFKHRVFSDSITPFISDPQILERRSRSPVDSNKLYDLTIRIPVAVSKKYEAIYLVAEKKTESGQEFMEAIHYDLYARKTKPQPK